MPGVERIVYDRPTGGEMNRVAVTVGARADLVLWETERPAEVVTTMAPRRLVVKAGRLSIEHERACRELWRTSE